MNQLGNNTMQLQLWQCPLSDRLISALEDMYQQSYAFRNNLGISTSLPPGVSGDVNRSRYLSDTASG